MGIIGINVVGKTKNASKPIPSTIFDDEAQAAQRSIDELKSQGVKHIILMTHIGYENDVALAQKLTDVDIIIGGDSHTFLGNYSHVVRKTPAGNYLTIVKNKSGDIVCIGQAWEYTKVFAQMNVKFNDDGSVRSCGGTSAIVIGAVFHGVNPIVIVIDNEGYGTQRPMTDGPFNDIPKLYSEELPKAFGFGQGFLCKTEDQLHHVLNIAKNTNELFIIGACVSKGEYSPGLLRLTAALKKRV